MRIAVNASSFSKDYFDFFLKLASTHPKEHFLFILDTENPALSLPQNSISLILKRKSGTAIQQRIWYSIKIPAALKKNKADILISGKVISMHTKIPQVLMVPDLRFIYQPSSSDKKSLQFNKKNTLRFLNKASKVIVTADFFKKEIIKRFQINEEKIKVIYPAVDNGFKKINFEEKELIKEKYAAGNEYFIYKGTISPQQNLLNLLKAFSFFKKRQKSTMQLLVVGNYGINSAEFLESLRLFRFKNEVKVLAELTEKEIQKAVAAAYAMVYVPVYDDKPASVLEAMNCHVPLVISSIDNLKEYCGDAALFSDPQNHKDIAEKLMMIFKDEKLRKELIEKEAIQLKQIAGNQKDSDFFNLIKDVQKNISSNEEI